MHLHTCSITASKFAPSWPPCASPYSLVYGLQVHLWLHTFLVSKCISPLAQTWPTNPAPNSLEYGIWGYDWVHSIPASKDISNCMQSRPPAIAVSLYDHHEANWWRFHSIRREFLINSGSGSRSIGWGWQDIEQYPSVRNHPNCVDLRRFDMSVWGTPQNAWIYKSSARVHGNKSWER